jgi:hypothetical protein
MKILHLTVTKEWFNKILSKSKKEDFRIVKSYWSKRLEIPPVVPFEDDFLKYDLIKIVNGYGETKPTILAKFDGVRITKEDEKTDLGIGCFYAIKIGEFIEVKNVI